MLELLGEIVDDGVDETVGLLLLNTAKDNIETEQRLEILKRCDESNVHNSGDTYRTPHALPEGFVEDLALYVGDDPAPYSKIFFEQREQYKGVARYWYIDQGSGQFYICGSASGTVRLFYKGTTDDIETDTAPTWPAQFHKLIVIRAAELFYPSDAGERIKSWDDKWKQVADRLENALILWDAQLKVSAMQGGRQPVNLAGVSNVVEG